MKQLFAEYPEEQREQYLRDNCYQVEKNSTYTRPLTKEEIDTAKDNLVEVSIEIREKEETFTELRKGHKKEIKDLKKDQGTYIREIEFGKATEIGEVFQFDDQDEGNMVIYDRLGRFISSRPLRTNERQISLLTAKKAE